MPNSRQVRVLLSDTDDAYQPHTTTMLMQYGQFVDHDVTHVPVYQLGRRIRRPMDFWRSIRVVTRTLFLPRGVLTRRFAKWMDVGWIDMGPPSSTLRGVDFVAQQAPLTESRLYGCACRVHRLGCSRRKKTRMAHTAHP